MLSETIVHMQGEHGKAAIAIQWGDEKVVLGASDSALALDLEALDNLLDALHEARRDLAREERTKVIMRIPLELKDALEAKARKEGLSQNAVFTRAIEEYLTGGLPGKQA